MLQTRDLDSITVGEALTEMGYEWDLDNFDDCLTDAFLTAWEIWRAHKVRLEKPKALRRIEKKACAKCGATSNLELHHIVPVSVGGGNDLTNLMILCKDCHKQTKKRENRSLDGFYKWLNEEDNQ